MGPNLLVNFFLCGNGIKIPKRIALNSSINSADLRLPETRQKIELSDENTGTANGTRRYRRTDKPTAVAVTQVGRET
jgi:hypothetical protein